MRLFLSSENLGNFPEVFLKMVGGNRKLAITENAKDDWSEKDRKNKVNEHLEQLKEEGFDAAEIDLRDYFGKPQKLEERLVEFDGLFAFGGNTFILRRACAYSGLDKILPKLTKNNQLAYGGSSAGPILIGPSLRGSEHGDYPEVVPAGYKEPIIWESLNIVPFYVVPHYKSSWWGKEAQQMMDYLKGKKFDYYALEDGQVVIVDGDKIEVLK